MSGPETTKEPLIQTEGRDAKEIASDLKNKFEKLSPEQRKEVGKDLNKQFSNLKNTNLKLFDNIMSMLTTEKIAASGNPQLVSALQELQKYLTQEPAAPTKNSPVVEKPKTEPVKEPAKDPAKEPVKVVTPEKPNTIDKKEIDDTKMKELLTSLEPAVKKFKTDMQQILKEVNDGKVNEATKNQRFSQALFDFHSSCVEKTQSVDQEVFKKHLNEAVKNPKVDPKIQEYCKKILEGLDAKVSPLDTKATNTPPNAPQANPVKTVETNPPKTSEIEMNLQQGLWSSEAFLKFVDTNTDATKAVTIGQWIRNYGTPVKPDSPTGSLGEQVVSEKQAKEHMRNGFKDSLKEKLAQFEKKPEAIPFTALNNITNMYNAMNGTWHTTDTMKAAIADGSLKGQLTEHMYEFDRIDEKTPASPIRYVGRAEKMELGTKDKDGKAQMLDLKAGTEIILTGRVKNNADGTTSVEASIGVGKEKKVGYIATTNLKLQASAVEEQPA